jgi:prepilin-type N-terminal cleavage/methylation domain-containing protein
MRVANPTHPLRRQEGFTLIEVMVAAFVLTVGVVVLLGVFDSTRKLTLVSERQSTMSHRAQGEMERLRAKLFSKLLMTSAPTKASKEINTSTHEYEPDYYVNYSSPVKCTTTNSTTNPCFQYNAQTPTGEEETLAIAGSEECKVSSECVPTTPTSWSAEGMSGKVYDFVTFYADKGVCSEKPVSKVTVECTEKTYKRLTVIVTVAVPSGKVPVPVRVSTLIAEPSATAKKNVKNGVENPFENPKTLCGSEPCINGIQRGTPQVWYLHDIAAPESGEPSSYAKTYTSSEGGQEGHATHATLATSGECTETKTSGCPKPDAMTTHTPTETKLGNYSTDKNTLGHTDGSEYYGGRALEKNSETEEKTSRCAAKKLANGVGEMWVTPPLTTALKLTGYGALSLYTQTINNVTGQVVTLCVGIYDVPEALGYNLTKNEPKLLSGGVVSEYTPDSWPTSSPGTPRLIPTITGLSFVFPFLEKAKLEAKETATVLEKHRIGLKIWPASSSATSIGIAYDTTAGGTETIEGKAVEIPAYSALLQLNTE